MIRHPMLESLEIRRLLSAGDLDSTFGAGGIAANPTPAGTSFSDSALLSNDKILIAGGGSYVLGRYNADGTLDTTFGDGGTVGTDSEQDESITKIIVQADGKIVALGTIGFTAETSTGEGTIARFNADGTLDSTFGGGDGIVENTYGSTGFDVQSDGRIFLAGASGKVTRLAADGSLDTSFGENGTSSYAFPEIRTLEILPDNKILVGGGSQFTLARLNADGSLDTGFGNNGVVSTSVPGSQTYYNSVADIALLSDGKFLAAGESSGAPVEQGDGGLVIVRYNADGSVDETFGNGGTYVSFGRFIFFNSIVTDTDGNAIVIGEQAFGVLAARVTADGQLDQTFGRLISEKGSSNRGGVFSLGGGIQSNGKLILPTTDTILQRVAFYRVLTSDASPLPIALDDAQHVLSVAGTSGDDVIAVREVGSALYATRNTFGRVFDLADVELVSITADAGNDEIDMFIESVSTAVTGGDGRDKISGGGRNDTLRGNGGRDFIDGGNGADLIIGGGGNDQIRGQGGADHIYGRAGSDNIQGNGGNDRLDADDENGTESDTLHGNAGNDTFVTQDNLVDQLFGDGGNDSAIADNNDLLTSIESIG